MSSQSENKNVFIIPYYNLPEEEAINFNKIIIPFSEFGSIQEKFSYIYNGIEKINFKERHPVFKRILLNEFGKENRKIRKILRKS